MAQWPEANLEIIALAVDIRRHTQRHIIRIQERHTEVVQVLVCIGGWVLVNGDEALIRIAHGFCVHEQIFAAELDCCFIQVILERQLEL